MMPSMDAGSAPEMASKAAFSAVEADNKGDLSAAADHYEEAANILAFVLDAGIVICSVTFTFMCSAPPSTPVRPTRLTIFHTIF
jgi:hypothetical protein